MEVWTKIKVDIAEACENCATSNLFYERATNTGTFQYL